MNNGGDAVSRLSIALVQFQAAPMMVKMGLVDDLLGLALEVLKDSAARIERLEMYVKKYSEKEGGR